MHLIIYKDFKREFNYNMLKTNFFPNFSKYISLKYYT